MAPIFANMQEVLFGKAWQALSLDAMTLAGSAYCVGAGLLFTFSRPQNFSRLPRLLALLTALNYSLWLLQPPSQLSLLLAVLFTASLGGCAAQAACAYTFVLNNTECFLGAALISLFFALNQLDFGLSLLSGLFPKAYLSALTAGTCLCLFFYQAEDFTAIEDKKVATFTPALQLTLYFFVAHYFIENFYTYLPAAATAQAAIANGITGLAVVLLTLVLQLTTKSSTWNMCNLFFLALITADILHLLPTSPFLQSAARLVHGFEQMGYIAAYYLLGCVFKKHGSFRLFKLALILILPLSAIAYVLPGYLAASAPGHLALFATLNSGLIFTVFILLSPAYSKHLFFADWSDDLQRVDMTDALSCLEPNGLLESYRLSPREKEIAVLLLQGEIAKQIAGDLAISPHTVNFHIKNLYKKLHVNNRAEFFARLGAASLNLPPPEQDEH